MLLKLLPHHVSIDLEEQRGQWSFQVWPILATFEPLVFDSSKLLPSFFFIICFCFISSPAPFCPLLVGEGCGWTSKLIFSIKSLLNLDKRKGNL